MSPVFCTSAARSSAHRAPIRRKSRSTTIIRNLKGFNVSALIAIGGDDTLSVASRLHKRGVPVIGVPKTIDNDIDGTDQTFGFDTAVNIATEAIDRLHTTAEAHSRALVVEVMGRQAGWIALWSGIAGGADVVLLPEFPMSLAEICKIIKARQASGKNFSIIAVAEGFKLEGHEVLQTKELDAFGHVRLGGIGEVLCKEIEKHHRHRKSRGGPRSRPTRRHAHCL